MTTSLDPLINLVYPKINAISPKETAFLRQAAISRLLDSISLEESTWVTRNEQGEETGRFNSKIEAIDNEILRLKNIRNSNIEIIGNKIKVNGEVLPLSEYEIFLENLKDYEA